MKLTDEEIANSPMVHAIIGGVIAIIKAQKFSYEERQVINADLIPRVSEKILRPRILTENQVRPPIMKPNMELRPSIMRSNMEELGKPIRIDMRRPLAQPPRPLPIQRRIITPQRPLPRAPPAPITHEQQQLTQDYGKINGLLRDPSVTYIECLGQGIPISIMRAGQKEQTKLVLNVFEIKQILEQVSKSAHIPLVVGVFRVALENFVMTAVISESIGSRFIIKKVTPYSLLDPSYSPNNF